MNFWAANYMDFSRMVRRIYRANREEMLYDLDEYLAIFKAFFIEYEERTGHPHPMLPEAQLRVIMEELPEVQLPGSRWRMGVRPSDYPDMIRSFFDARGKRPDCGLVDFMPHRTPMRRF